LYINLLSILGKTEMSLKKRLPTDLKLVLILVLLTDLIVLIPPLSGTPIRTVLGLPMVLFLPGYALIAALFPGKDDLDGIERIALSFGLSIAVVPLIGLILNYTPWGIRLLPILVSISLFTVSMCLVAVYRRDILDAEAFDVPFEKMYLSVLDELTTTPQSRLDRILSIILVISILASVLTLVYVVVTPKQGEKFTEFYILGPDGMADGYNTQLVSGEQVDVVVGIVNHEYDLVNYSLEMRLDDQTMDMPDDLEHISLSHNMTWEMPLSFVPSEAGTDMKLQYLLYREDNKTEPYRDLHLWINVSEGEKFTDLYVSGPDGSDLDSELTLGDELVATIGIFNNEYEMTNYSLELEFNGRGVPLSDNFHNISLEHYSRWERPIAFTPVSKGTDIEMEYILYRESNFTAPYRKQTVLLNVTE